MLLTDQDFLALCAQHGLEAQSAALLPYLRRRIGYDRTESAPAAIGASRIGGGPDVPEGFDWPMHQGRPLDFILQINLKDLQGFPAGLALPTEGVLSFFYDLKNEPDGSDPANLGGHRTLLFDQDRLQRRSAPDADHALEASGLVFHPSLSLPHPFSSEGERMFGELASQRMPLDDDPFNEAYWDLVSELASHGSPSGKRHGIGGYSHNVQDDMKVQAQLVSNGLSFTHAVFEDPRSAALAAGSDEWTLLLQLDHDMDDDREMWGDCGMLYWWIRKSDAAAGDMSRTWMTMQFS